MSEEIKVNKLERLEKELYEYHQRHPEVTLNEANPISSVLSAYTKPIKQAMSSIKNPGAAVAGNAINKAVKAVTPKKTPKLQPSKPASQQSSNASNTAPSSLDSFKTNASSQVFKDKNKAEQVLTNTIDTLKALAGIPGTPAADTAVPSEGEASEKPNT
jgi:hypothetical protein